MFLRKSIAVVAACFLGITFTQVDAVAHGFGGFHGGFGPAFGHGFVGHGFFGHGLFGHGFHHSGHHDAHHDFHNHQFAMHGFDHGDGSHLGGHFGHWEPGHWHDAGGFGGHGHWSSRLEGVWGL